MKKGEARMRVVAMAMLIFLSGALELQAAATCNGTRLELDMKCCLGQTCSADRPGRAAVEGAVRGPPTSQGLFNLRQGFTKCQQLDERNNFYACERADKKGPYNTGRRLLGLPPG
jgi:hypothetical protein